MEKRIKVWHLTIDKTTSDFLNAFGDLNNEELNWKPDTKSWSIAQVIDHLVKTNESYFPIPNLIRKVDFNPSFLTKIGFVPKIFGKMILKGVDPNTVRKVKTGKVFEPAESNISQDILEKFKFSQNALHNFINNNHQLILNKVVIPSPLNKHIVYHFDTVIDIIVNHQVRHFNQARTVLERQNQENFNG